MFVVRMRRLGSMSTECADRNISEHLDANISIVGEWTCAQVCYNAVARRVLLQAFPNTSEVSLATERLQLLNRPKRTQMNVISAKTADGRTVRFDIKDATRWDGPILGFNMETLYRVGGDWVLSTSELLAAAEPPVGEVITEDAALMWLLRHDQQIPPDMIAKAEAMRLT